MQAHFGNQNPQKALVFFLTGAVGSGKNFVAGMIEEHYNSKWDQLIYLVQMKFFQWKVHKGALYIKDKRAELLVRWWYSRKNSWCFFNSINIFVFRGKLKKKIENIAKYSCERALIILDEVDKMPPELLEAVSSYMMSENPDIDDSPSPYRKLVFLLLAWVCYFSLRVDIILSAYIGCDLGDFQI